eukprot:ANDGO_05867.mRNA.1 hypothetical protein H257_01798
MDWASFEASVRLASESSCGDASHLDRLLACPLLSSPIPSHMKGKAAYLRGILLLLHPDPVKKQQSLEFLSAAVKFDPQFPDALVALGNAYLAVKNDKNVAVQCYDHVLSLFCPEPNEPNSNNAAADSSTRKKSWMEIARSIGSSERKSALRDALQQKARVLGSISLAKDAVALNPRHAEAWYVLGTCELAHMELENALRAYAQAEKMGLSAPELLYNRGQIYFYLERFDAAIAQFQSSGIEYAKDMIDECKTRFAQTLRAIQTVSLSASTFSSSASASGGRGGGGGGISWSAFSGVGKVVWIVSGSDATPLVCIVENVSDGSRSVVSLYNVSADAVRVGSLLDAPREAWARQKVCVDQSSEQHYETSQLFTPSQLRIDGKPVSQVRPRTAVRR